MSYWWISRLVIVLLAVSIACYVIDRSSFCQKSEGFENSASSDGGGGDSGDSGDSSSIPETRMTQAYPDDASYAPPPPPQLPPTDSSTPDTGSENESDSDSDDSGSDNENDNDENDAVDSDNESDISENENENDCNATATTTAMETTVTAETYTDTYTDTTDTTAYVYADTGDGTSNTTSRAAAEVQPRDDTDQCSVKALSSAPIMSYGNTYFPHTSWTVPQQRPPPCTANAQPLVMPVYTGGVPEGAMELQSSTNHQLLPTTYTGASSSSSSSSSAAAQPDTPATYRSYYPGYHARVAAT
jgi:hypothetical protein